MERSESSVERSPGLIQLEDPEVARALLGEGGTLLATVEELLRLRVHVRGTELRLEGDEHDVELGARLVAELYDLAREGYPIWPSDLPHAIDILAADQRAHLRDVFLDTVCIASDKRRIAPRSLNQKRYIDLMRGCDLVFGVGPAGTGKTYLAMAMAVAALKRREVRRIVLTRPAVEAGEKLGFLPGDLIEKVNPYLRPLYDALNDMMAYDQAAKLLTRGTIEVAPLAFMRGRTLGDAFVILDEAQNTTTEQMKMFLTRLGLGSRAVVTGDLTQIDLPSGQRSGLVEATRILDGVDGIAFARFGPQDVVRHNLVQRIVDAYDRATAAANGSDEPRS